jgi:hypothetical protein
VEFVLVQPSHLKNAIRVLFRQQGQDTPAGTTL